jgi:hypothetical protein
VKNIVRGRLTYANVIATLALFLALGGGAYAASRLPKNSIGSKQIKKNAVNSAKVKNHSLKAADFKAGQLPAGPQGPTGPQGAKGPGATSFEVAVPQNGTRNVVKVSEGIFVKALCAPTLFELTLASEQNEGNLDASGIATSFGSTPTQSSVNYTATNEFGVAAVSTPWEVHLEVLARNTAVSQAFTKFDLHGSAPACILRGMITPSMVG